MSHRVTPPTAPIIRYTALYQGFYWQCPLCAGISPNFAHPNYSHVLRLGQIHLRACRTRPAMDVLRRH